MPWSHTDLIYSRSQFLRGWLSEEETRETTLVWTEIREAAGLVSRAGGNPVEILLWSRGKTLSAVREEIRRIVYGSRFIVLNLLQCKVRTDS